MNRPSLSLSEWGLVLIILGCLSTLILANTFSRQSQLPELKQECVLKPPQWIQVTIEGAVQHPGDYRLLKGSTIEQLIEKARPLENSDLSSLILTKKLRAKQKIFIPENEVVMVFIEGAVENPGWLRLPKGTKISDLKRSIRFMENSDATCLSGKRRLKQGEKIIIPSKPL